MPQNFGDVSVDISQNSLQMVKVVAEITPPSGYVFQAVNPTNDRLLIWRVTFFSSPRSNKLLIGGYGKTRVGGFPTAFCRGVFSSRIATASSSLKAEEVQPFREEALMDITETETERGMWFFFLSWLDTPPIGWIFSSQKSVSKIFVNFYPRSLGK